MTVLAGLKLAVNMPAAPDGPRIAAVVLAAGASRRMEGKNKLLLDVGGKPMVRRTVETVLAFGAVETVIVTGHDANAVGAALADLPVTLVHNRDHQHGQPTSVAAGVRALRKAVDAVMVILGDQPLLTVDDLRALVTAYQDLDGRSILIPEHDGKRGNPIVFAARHIPEVVHGGVRIGCRHLIETHGDAVARIAMASEAFTVDCDTPEDYRRLLRRFSA